MAFIVITTFVLFALLASCVLAATRKKEVFEVQFPPISDEEYVARCRPGTDPNVAFRVRRILAESLGIDYERIHPTARLVEDLGAY
jgi:hypothetical protein